MLLASGLRMQVANHIWANLVCYEFKFVYFSAFL